MLNRHNLSIANLADKEGASRFTLSAILVHPDYTVETDGRQLVQITTPKANAADFPQIPGMEPATNTWKPFLLPRQAALDIAKALPKKSTIPVLAHAAVSAETDVNGYAVLGVTDLERSPVFRVHKPEGNFPDFERVIPKREDTKFRVAFDARLLGSVLKQIESLYPANEKAYCEFSFTDEIRALRIDATAGESQHLTAVVMPYYLKEGSELPPNIAHAIITALPEYDQADNWH